MRLGFWLVLKSKSYGNALRVLQRGYLYLHLRDSTKNLAPALEHTCVAWETSRIKIV